MRPAQTLTDFEKAMLLIAAAQLEYLHVLASTSELTRSKTQGISHNFGREIQKVSEEVAQLIVGLA